MSGPTFEDELDDWIKDGPERAPTEVLQSVLSSFPTTRQRWGLSAALWRFQAMTSLSRLTSAVTGAAVVLLVFGVGAFVLSRPGPGGTGDVATPPAVVASASPSASPAPTPSPIVTPDVTPSPSPTPAATPSPTATPTPPPALALCVSTDLSARITMWEGAAGSRIAHVDLTNDSTKRCTIQVLDQVQLLGGNSAILIDGTPPVLPTPSRIGLAAGSKVSTLVQTTNYCGTEPVAPVTLAFILGDGSRVVAAPFSPTDATVPPCNGPGQPAAIDMHPWAP